MYLKRIELYGFKSFSGKTTIEFEPGVSCIAAPVFQRDGSPDMAVSISFSNGRIREVDQNEVARDLLALTNRLSARLGYRKN